MRDSSPEKRESKQSVPYNCLGTISRELSRAVELRQNLAMAMSWTLELGIQGA